MTPAEIRAAAEKVANVCERIGVEPFSVITSAYCADAALTPDVFNATFREGVTTTTHGTSTIRYATIDGVTFNAVWLA